MFAPITLRSRITGRGSHHSGGLGLASSADEKNGEVMSWGGLILENENTPKWPLRWLFTLSQGEHAMRGLTHDDQTARRIASTSFVKVRAPIAHGFRGVFILDIVRNP